MSVVIPESEKHRTSKRDTMLTVMGACFLIAILWFGKNFDDKRENAFNLWRDSILSQNWKSAYIDKPANLIDIGELKQAISLAKKIKPSHDESVERMMIHIKTDARTYSVHCKRWKRIPDRSLIYDESFGSYILPLNVNNLLQPASEGEASRKSLDE